MSFVPAVFGALAGAAASPVGAAVIGTGAAVAGSKFMGAAPNKAVTPNPLPLPQAPKSEAASEVAATNVMKKRAAFSQSIYTSPLGVSGEANIARKTLLGQ